MKSKFLLFLFLISSVWATCTYFGNTPENVCYSHSETTLQIFTPSSSSLITRDWSTSNCTYGQGTFLRSTDAGDPSKGNYYWVFRESRCTWLIGKYCVGPSYVEYRCYIRDPPCNSYIYTSSEVGLDDNERLIKANCVARDGETVADDSWLANSCQSGHYCTPNTIYSCPEVSYKLEDYNKAACACALNTASVQDCDPTATPPIITNCWSKYARSGEVAEYNAYGCCHTGNYFEDSWGECYDTGSGARYVLNDADEDPYRCETILGLSYYSDGSGQKKCCGDDYNENWCADDWICINGKKRSHKTDGKAYGALKNCDGSPYCECYSCPSAQTVKSEQLSTIVTGGILDYDGTPNYDFSLDNTGEIPDYSKSWVYNAVNRNCHSTPYCDFVQGWVIDSGEFCPPPGTKSDGTNEGLWDPKGTVCHHWKDPDQDDSLCGPYLDSLGTEQIGCKVTSTNYQDLPEGESCIQAGDVGDYTYDDETYLACFTEDQSQLCDADTGWECKWYYSSYNPDGKKPNPGVYDYSTGSCLGQVDLTQGGGDGCEPSGWVYEKHPPETRPTDCSYSLARTLVKYEDGQPVKDYYGNYVYETKNYYYYDCTSKKCSPDGWTCGDDSDLDRYASDCNYCEDCDENRVCDTCQEYENKAECPDMMLTTESQGNGCHCGDGVDNDGDGAIDCCDMDCEFAESCKNVDEKWIESLEACQDEREKWISWGMPEYAPDCDQRSDAWVDLDQNGVRDTCASDMDYDGCNDNIDYDPLSACQISSCIDGSKKCSDPYDVQMPNNEPPETYCAELTSAETCNKLGNSGCDWKGCISPECWKTSDKTACNSIVGCQWNSEKEVCTERNCRAYDNNKDSCTNEENGCEWTGSCSNKDCGSIRNQDECLSYSDCSWTGPWYNPCKDVRCWDLSDQDSCESETMCTWLGGDSGYCNYGGCTSLSDEDTCESTTRCAWDDTTGCNTDQCWDNYGTDENSCVQDKHCKWDGKCVAPTCNSYTDDSTCSATNGCEWVGECSFKLCKPITKCEGTEASFCVSDALEGHCENLCYDGVNNDQTYETSGGIRYNLADSCDIACNNLDENLDGICDISGYDNGDGVCDSKDYDDDGDGVPNNCDYDINGDGCLNSELDTYDGSGKESDCTSPCNRCENGNCVLSDKDDELELDGLICKDCDGKSKDPLSTTAATGTNCYGDCVSCSQGSCLKTDICQESWGKCNNGETFFVGQSALCDSYGGSCKTSDSDQTVCEHCGTGIWAQDYSGDSPNAPCCGDDGGEDNFVSKSFVCMKGKPCGTEPSHAVVDNGDGIFDPGSDSCGCAISKQLEKCNTIDGSSEWSGVCAGELCCETVVVDYAGNYECMTQGNLRKEQIGYSCDDTSDAEYTEEQVKGGQNGVSVGCCDINSCWDEETSTCVSDDYVSGRYLCAKGTWDVCGTDTQNCEKNGDWKCHYNGWSKDSLVCGENCKSGYCKYLDQTNEFECAYSAQNNNRPTNAYCSTGDDCCSGVCLDKKCAATTKCETSTLGLDCSIDDRTGKCAKSGDQHICCDGSKGELLIGGEYCVKELTPDLIGKSCYTFEKWNPSKIVKASPDGTLGCCDENSCLNDDGSCWKGTDDETTCYEGKWLICNEDTQCLKAGDLICRGNRWTSSKSASCGLEDEGICSDETCNYCSSTSENENALDVGDVIENSLCTNSGFRTCKGENTYVSSESYLCENEAWYTCTKTPLPENVAADTDFSQSTSTTKTLIPTGMIDKEYICSNEVWKKCDTSQRGTSISFKQGENQKNAICTENSWLVCEGGSAYFDLETTNCGCENQQNCYSFVDKKSGLCQDNLCCSNWTTSIGGCYNTQKDACLTHSGMFCDTLSDSKFQERGICSGELCCINDAAGGNAVVSTQSEYVGIESCVSSLREEHIGLFCDDEPDGEFDGIVGIIAGKIKCCGETDGCSFGENESESQTLPTYVTSVSTIPKADKGISVCKNCNDFDPCTDDYCDAGVCVHKQICNACGDGFCAPGECETCASDCTKSDCRDGVCNTLAGESCEDPDCICDFNYLTPQDRSFELNEKKQISVFVKNDGNFREGFSVYLKGDVKYSIDEQTFYLEPGEEHQAKVALLEDAPGAYLYEVGIKPDHGSEYIKSVLTVIKSESKNTNESFFTSPAFKFSVVIFIMMMGFGSAFIYGTQLFGKKKIEETKFSPYQNQEAVRQQNYYVPAAKPAAPAQPIDFEALQKELHEKSQGLVKKD